MCRTTGRDSHSYSQRENRIQNRTDSSRKVCAFVECFRVSYRASAPDELCPISLAGDLADGFRSARDHVCTPDRGLGCRAWTAGRKQGRFGFKELRLHEQVAEGGMCAIRIGWRQHHFRVARELDFLCLQRPVGQHHPPDFGCIVRRHGDFSHRIDVTITTDKRDSIAGKQHSVPLGLGTGRLMRRRPHMPGA